MNMTPNDPRTEALMCKSSGIQPENSEAWIIRIQALTAKETMTKISELIFCGGYDKNKTHSVIFMLSILDELKMICS
jgi:hypothetical protein